MNRDVHIALTIASLACLWAGCGDGQHVGNAGESEDPADAAIAAGGGDGSAVEPPPDVRPDAGPPIETGELSLERTWSEGLVPEVDDLQWAGPGEIELRLGMTSAAGTPIGGLDPRALHFTEDGVDLGSEVLFELRREQNLRVVLVLDLSRSMQDAGAVEPLRDAARTLLSGLPSAARIGIVRFATDYQMVGDFTDDALTLAHAVDELAPAADRAGRFTNLWGALQYAAERLGEPVAGEGRIVVVFTDGQDNVAESDFVAAREALSQAGALVYAVGLGQDVDAEALRALAGASHYTGTADPEALSRIFDDIATRIGELVRLRYTTPKKSGSHTLSVDVRDGERSGGFDLRFSLD